MRVDSREQKSVATDFVKVPVPVCAKRDGLGAAGTKTGLKAKLL